MNAIRRTVAATKTLLILPAVIFMTALFVRDIQPLQYEPAHTAHRIVTWYAEHPRVGLWVLLMALPLFVFATGCAVLVHAWNDDDRLRQATWATLATMRKQLTVLFVAAATLTAGGVLAIVALHALTD